MSVLTHDQSGGQNASSPTPMPEQSIAKRDTQDAAVAEQIIASLASTHPEIRSQLEILQRTVTLVFWYKPNAEPLRLQQMIPTFPFLQLSRLTTLTADLGLTPSSYLDTFNRDSRQWDQHTIESVRVVDGHHRLLYRIRKSLLDGLSEEECLGLTDEVENQLKPKMAVSSQPNISQPTPNSTSGATSTGEHDGLNNNSSAPTKSSSLKRPAPNSLEADSPSKIVVMEGPQRQQQPYPAYLSAPVDTETPSAVISTSLGIQSSPNAIQDQPAQNPDVHMTSPSPSDTGATGSAHAPYFNNLSRNMSHSQYQYQTPMTYSTPASTTTTASGPAQASPTASPLPQYLVQPQSSAPLIPYHPHPPLKRWPNDYTVAALSAGFRAMEALVQQTPAGGAPMTQRAAFERVFGSRYVKSTVCRHRGVWRKAPQSLREEFEALGEDERACWGEFVRRVEGRPPSRVVAGATPMHEAGLQSYNQQSPVHRHTNISNGGEQHHNGISVLGTSANSNGVPAQPQLITQVNGSNPYSVHQHPENCQRPAGLKLTPPVMDSLQYSDTGTPLGQPLKSDAQQPTVPPPQPEKGPEDVPSPPRANGV